MNGLTNYHDSNGAFGSNLPIKGTLRPPLTHYLMPVAHIGNGELDSSIDSLVYSTVVLHDRHFASFLVTLTPRARQQPGLPCMLAAVYHSTVPERGYHDAGLVELRSSSVVTRNRFRNRFANICLRMEDSCR